MSKLSVASLLPPDIIYVIAYLVHPDPKIKSHPIYDDNFVGLAQVCRSWRNALLSYPTFWTKIEIPLRSLWFLKEVLLRSADQPLEILIHLEKKKTMDYHLEMAFSHLHHIRSLTLRESYGSTPDLDSIFRLLDSGKVAPILKVFTFHPQHERQNQGSIPENFLAGIAPNLEELRISSMTISHQMPVLKTITRLHLDSVQGITSVNQLFDMLEAISHLEVLELYSLKDLSPVFDVHDLDNRSIQFPALKKLSLSLKPVILMAVLGHTTLPSEIDWIIYCHNTLIDSTVDIDPLLSFLSRTRNGTCLTLRINEWYLQMDFAQKPSGPYDISLRMILSGKEDCIHRLHSIFVNLDLSKVYFCDILYPSSTSDFPYWIAKYQTTFNSLFFLFDHLTKLVIACDHTDPLWQFTSQLLPGEGSTTLPCPLLDDLKVGIVSTTGKTLTQILARRKEAGSVLRILCVEYDHCDRSIRKKRKPVLEELVENVEIAALTLKIKDEIYFEQEVPSEGPGRVVYEIPICDLNLFLCRSLKTDRRSTIALS